MFLVPHASLGASNPASVKNSEFSSSSEKFSLTYSAENAREGSEWCAYYDDEHQWLEAIISYDVPDDNQRFKLEAKGNTKSGITYYLLNSSTDGKIWNALKKGEVRRELSAVVK